MKTIYLDCGNGAAGDMLSAALWELVDNKREVLDEINSMGLEKVETYALPAEKQGVNGTHFMVSVGGEVEHSEDVKDASVARVHFYMDGHDHGDMHEHMHDHDGMHGHDNHMHDHMHGSDDHDMHGHGDHDHSHEHHDHSHHHGQNNLSKIENIINSLSVSEKVKEDAKGVFKLLAEAESTVHGQSITDIHFHEVGTLDAVADIVTVALLVEKLAPEQIIASSVNTGSGKVKCAHGILPVPAPATSLLLQGIPVYSNGVNGELCTPTGAALLKYFVTAFVPLPPMNIEAIGYGMGEKDYETANYLRAFLGEADDVTAGKHESAFDDHSELVEAGHKHHHHHEVSTDEKQRKAISNRLARSIGHLDSVKRMVDSNRDAGEILIQLAAVESSISGTSRAIIKEHFKTAIDKAAKQNDEETVENLYGLIDKFLK